MKLLPALIVLAPMYGGGALLIREIVRRTGRGWPSILVLGMAYGIFEEAFHDAVAVQSELSEVESWIARAGVYPFAGDWGVVDIWMLMVHGIWSISTPIALVEASVPDRARTPWLGRWGLVVVALVFLFGACANTAIGYKQDHYLASMAQFVGAAVIIVLLVASAFLIPRRRNSCGYRFCSIGVDGGRDCAGIWVGSAVCSDGLGLGSGGGAACAGCDDVGARDSVVGRIWLGAETSARSGCGRGAGLWMACVFAASGGGEAGR